MSSSSVLPVQSGYAIRTEAATRCYGGRPTRSAHLDRSMGTGAIMNPCLTALPNPLKRCFCSDTEVPVRGRLRSRARRCCAQRPSLLPAGALSMPNRFPGRSRACSCSSSPTTPRGQSTCWSGSRAIAELDVEGSSSTTPRRDRTFDRGDELRRERTPAVPAHRARQPGQPGLRRQPEARLPLRDRARLRLRRAAPRRRPVRAGDACPICSRRSRRRGRRGLRLAHARAGRRARAACRSTSSSATGS